MKLDSCEGRAPSVLRFSADIGTENVTAFVSQAALNARYGGLHRDADLQTVVSEHRSEIHAAVICRIQAGARRPVILRASDLCQRHTGGFTACCCA